MEELEVVIATNELSVLDQLTDFEAYEEVNFVGERAIKAFVKSGLESLSKLFRAIHTASGTASLEKIVIKKGDAEVTIEKADISKLRDAGTFAKEVLEQLNS